MPYITIKRPPGYIQMSFDDMLDGVDDLSKYIVSSSSATITRYYKRVNPILREHTDIDGMIAVLAAFNEKHKELFAVERSTLYRSFKIPKRSGGRRQINAPEDALMNALRELKVLFEHNIFALYHTTAFAYMPGRCTIDAVKRHQKNESRWFLKLDFSNFFGSTTPEFIMKMLGTIYPFSEICSREDGKKELAQALSLCFLDGGLPQGTPISPMLTNLMMIPIDHKISNSLRDEFRNRFVYTRYADDIHISCKYSFMWKPIQTYIEKVLEEFGAPFSLNKEKTHYGSSAGENWILGVKLNKDNNISLGWREKKNFKAMLQNYVENRRDKKEWPLEEIQHLSGLISYYRMVEREYIDYLIAHYSKKFRADIAKLIHDDLSIKTKEPAQEIA